MSRARFVALIAGVLIAASGLSAVPARATEGCVAMNPGGTECTYDAAQSGSAVAAGRGYSVSVQRRGTLLSWRGSQPTWDAAPFVIYPGDRVTVMALLPGSAVYAGDPTFVRAHIGAPPVGVGPVSTPEMIPADVPVTSFVGAPSFATGILYTSKYRYHLSAHTTTGPTGDPSGVRVLITKQQWNGQPDLVTQTSDPYLTMATDDVIVDVASSGFHYENSAMHLKAQLPNIGLVDLSFSAAIAGHRVLWAYGVGYLGQDNWVLQSDTAHGFDENRIWGTIGGDVVTFGRDGAWGADGTGYAVFARPPGPPRS